MVKTPYEGGGVAKRKALKRKVPSSPAWDGGEGPETDDALGQDGKILQKLQIVHSFCASQHMMSSSTASWRPRRGLLRDDIGAYTQALGLGSCKESRNQFDTQSPGRINSLGIEPPVLDPNTPVV